MIQALSHTACEDRLLGRMCDGQAEERYYDQQGRLWLVCEWHYRHTYNKRTCDATGCKRIAKDTHITVEEETKYLCGEHNAFMQMYSTDDPQYEPERARLAERRKQVFVQMLDNHPEMVAELEAYCKAFEEEDNSSMAKRAREYAQAIADYERKALG